MRIQPLKRLVFVLLMSLGISAHAATFTGGAPHSTNNDDSCDIALLPAATLLLPYFEVDLADRNGETTLFTITNASPMEQVAHITLWTDFAFPVIDFNVYLTGYDVQGLNLYDVIALGQIAPPNGTGFDDAGSPVGDFSDDNPAVEESTCRNLPMQVAAAYRTRMQQAFTKGKVPAIGSTPGCSQIGGDHLHATGYATIDLVRRCGATNPTEPTYYTEEIAFDNVLTGDFMQVNGGQNFAQGNPLVHIRAIPEGGTFASRAADPASYRTNTPTTFYGRYQSPANPVADGRQPLPSTFMARWISGGLGSFESSFKIWRGSRVGANAECSDFKANEDNRITDVVRFDEEENAVARVPDCQVPCESFDTNFPSASVTSIDDPRFPQTPDNGIAGWLYLNLHNSAAETIGAQAWVVASMRAEGRFSVDMDATALGNGCTPAITVETQVTSESGETIGPAENVNP
jgi:hypothetical protein